MCMKKPRPRGPEASTPRCRASNPRLYRQRSEREGCRKPALLEGEGGQASPVVQDGPDLLEGLGHVEADVGDGVPGHAQHRGQHVLGSDVLAADLGQHLESVRSRGDPPKVTAASHGALPPARPLQSPSGLTPRLSHTGDAKAGLTRSGDSVFSASSPFPSHPADTPVPRSPAWKPPPDGPRPPTPRPRLPFVLWERNLSLDPGPSLSTVGSRGRRGEKLSVPLAAFALILSFRFESRARFI